MAVPQYGSLSNVQVMAAVTVTEGVSPVDSELTMYLAKAADFIDNALKGVAMLPLDPVPAIIDTIAEFYASGLFLARNNLLEGQTQHPNVVLAMGSRLTEKSKSASLSAMPNLACQVTPAPLKPYVSVEGIANKKNNPKRKH